VAFALREAGLLGRRRPKTTGENEERDVEEPEMFVLSREMVEKCVRQRQVKPKYLFLENVLL